MPQPYRTNHLDRHAASPSRTRIDAGRPASEPVRSTVPPVDEPPVLLQLADFSRFGTRRPGPRRLFTLPQVASIPLPDPAPSYRPTNSERVVASQPPAPANAADEPHDSSLAAPPGAEVISSTVAPPTTPIAKPPTSTPAATSVPGPTVVPATTTAAAATESVGTTHPEDSEPKLWERLATYRPGLPVLLGLVLVTIGVAYIYRPQETPPRRRGSQEAADPQRQFDKQFDSQRPRSLAPADRSKGGSVADSIANQTAGDVPKLPVLDLPGDRANRDDLHLSEQPDLEGPALGTNRAPDSDDADSFGAADHNPAPTTFAGRPRSSDLRDTVAPPAMHPESPIEAEPASEDEVEDDGPPPDIRGHSYPRTSPSTFIYRPLDANTREANRPLSTQGETR